MRKLFIIFLITFLLFGIALPTGFVLADSHDTDNSGSGSDSDNSSSSDSDSSSNSGSDSSGSGDGKTSDESRLKFEVRRTIINEDGSVSEIRIKIEERTRNGVIERKIKVKSDTKGGEFEAKTKLELKETLVNGEESIFAILSNGDEALINITPDRIAEIALERLGSRNLTLELKEIKHKNVPKVVYNVEANKHGKFLGVFKLKLKIEGQIDPGTGEFLSISKPWWAFLVTGEDSDQTGDDGNDDMGEDENETTVELTIELTAENDSNQSGTAILIEENEEITITISTVGFVEDVSQPAHIHSGSCPGIGGIQYPLTNVLNGESVTTIDVTLDQLESELPLAINIHKSVDEASVYVSCGNLVF